MHVCTYAQTDGQPKNITPPAPSIRWMEAEKCFLITADKKGIHLERHTLMHIME